MHGIGQPDSNGEPWTSRTLAAWMAERLGRLVTFPSVWDNVHCLGAHMRRCPLLQLAARADAQVAHALLLARAATLRALSERIRSATRFPWWPRRITRRQGSAMNLVRSLMYLRLDRRVGLIQERLDVGRTVGSRGHLTAELRGHTS